MLRKQEVKLLILSDLADFNEKKVIEKLDELKRRHFDIVVVIGNVNKVLMTEISLLFESALITTLPKDKYSKALYEELGIVEFNLRKQKVGQTEIIGYGSRHYNPNGIAIDKKPECLADVLVSYHAPMRIHDNENYTPEKINTEEINRYGAFCNPKIIFHGDRKMNKTTELSNGTKIISCYGIVPYILTYYKEIEEEERKDENN